MTADQLEPVSSARLLEHRCAECVPPVKHVHLAERSPEKAGVGGSTPSLATIIPKDLAAQGKNFQPTIQPMILTELAP